MTRCFLGEGLVAAHMQTGDRIKIHDKLATLTHWLTAAGQCSVCIKFSCIGSSKDTFLTVGLHVCMHDDCLVLQRQACRLHHMQPQTSSQESQHWQQYQTFP
jgi:hypothetical protein